MTLFTRIFGLFLVMFACSSVNAVTNLCRNPGFEQIDDNKNTKWELGAGASIVSKGLSGKNALRLASDKKGFDPLACQTKIMLKPGKRYRLSYHVRGDAGSAEVTGFQFFRVYTSWDRLIEKNGDDYGEVSQHDGMEWQDAYDAWQKRTLEFTAPNKLTAGMTITCQLKGPGSAFFDDFTLEPLPDEVKNEKSLISICFDKPVYRNAIFSSTAVNTIIGEIIVKSSDIRMLEMSFCKIGEKAFWSKRLPVSEKKLRFSMPVGDIAVGDYHFTTLGLSESGKIVYTAKEVIRKLPPKKTEVTVDSENRLLLNGKPYFPIGLWIAPKNSRQAYEMSRAGFNVFRTNIDESKLNLAKRFGLKIIGCMPDEYVFNTNDAKKKALDLKERQLIDQYKDNPELLAWFICDEALWCGQPLPPIKEAYRLHRELDPYRPVMMNAAPRSKISALAEYAEACDLYGVDIYPVPSGNSHSEMEDKSISSVGKYTDKCFAVVVGKKPVIMTLQGFAWGHLGDPKGEGIYPTFEETRFMAYDAIVHGATGIMYWGTYYIAKVSFWQVLFKIASELRDMSSVLVSDTISPCDIKSDNKSKHALRFLHKVCEERDYIIAVNESNELVKATVTTDIHDKSLDVLFENRRVTLTNTQFADIFAPYAVHIYTNSKKMPPSLFPTPAPVDEKHLEGNSFEDDAAIRENSRRYQGNANWIWTQETKKDKDSTVFFRKKIEVPEKLQKATMIITADDQYVVYLNGKKIGSDVSLNGWPMAEEYDVTSQIKAGQNLIAVQVKNDANTYGALLCEINFTFQDDKVQTIVSDASWRISLLEVHDWLQEQFDDANWSEAKVLGSFGIAPWSANVLIRAAGMTP